MGLRSKVMLFSHLCDPIRITGAEKWLLFIATNLSQRYEVVLVVPCYGKLLVEATDNHIQVIIQDYPLLWSLYESSPAMHQELANLMVTDAYRLLVNQLQTYRPDWIVVNTSVCALPAAAAKELGLPVAWIINEILYPTIHQIEAVQIINKYADWIIGISESVLAPFSIPLVNDKKRLIFPSWNDAALRPEKWEENRRSLRAAYGIKDQEMLFGSVSAMLSPHKGTDQFIRMAGMLMSRFPQVKFLIAGSLELTEYVEECKSLVQATPDPSRILFHSFEDRIEQLYPALDAVVVPSMIDEGFGMTALEGLIFGKAVLAYGSGGIREVLTKTGNGEFLVPKGDLHRLVQTASNLMQNEIGMGGISNRNRQAAVDIFGEEAFQKQFDTLLQQVDLVVSDLNKRHQLAKVHHSEGSILRGNLSYVVFLLEDGVKRPFCNEAAMVRYRYNIVSDVQVVNDAELQAYPTGHVLSTEEPFEVNSPMNMMLIGSGKGVYWRRGETIHPVVSLEALRATGWDPNRIVSVSDDILAQFKQGSLITTLNPYPLTIAR